MVSGARVMATLFLVLFALPVLFAPLVLFAAPAAASSDGPTGVWLTGKKKAAIRIYDCDAGLCGRIVWLKKPLDKTGRLKRDKNNPDAASRNQPLCGVVILRGLKSDEPGVWVGGTIYNPQDGHTYAGLIEVESEDTLMVRGYLGIPFLGKTEIWTKMEEPADSCT